MEEPIPAIGELRSLPADATQGLLIAGGHEETALLQRLLHRQEPRHEPRLRDARKTDVAFLQGPFRIRDGEDVDRRAPIDLPRLFDGPADDGDLGRPGLDQAVGRRPGRPPGPQHDRSSSLREGAPGPERPDDPDMIRIGPYKMAIPAIDAIDRAGLQRGPFDFVEKGDEIDFEGRRDIESVEPHAPRHRRRLARIPGEHSKIGAVDAGLPEKPGKELGAPAVKDGISGHGEELQFRSPPSSGSWRRAGYERSDLRRFPVLPPARHRRTRLRARKPSPSSSPLSCRGP